jgi:hypothetical protein
MSSIRCSVNPSNLTAPVKVNSKLLKDNDITYRQPKYKKSALDIVYDSFYNEDYSIKYKRKVDNKLEDYFAEEDKQFIRSSIPKRFYKIYK